MAQIPADRIGTQATPTTKAVWPKFDVFGQEYDRATVTRVHKGGQFVVVPAGKAWTWPVDAPKADKK